MTFCQTTLNFWLKLIIKRPNKSFTYLISKTINFTLRYQNYAAPVYQKKSGNPLASSAGNLQQIQRTKPIVNPKP